MKNNEILNALTQFFPKARRAFEKAIVNMGVVAVMALALPWERGFSQTLLGWDVNGVAAGTTTLNATTAASNITGGQLSLTGLTASGSANTFGGSGWNLTNTFNETNDYLSFSVTPSAGYEVTYSSLQWDQGVTSTAPNNSRWGYKVGTGAFTLQTPFASTDSSNAAWDFTDFTATDTVEFRFWTYGATSVGGGTSASTGASRIRNLTGDDLILFGSVAAIVPAGASMFWTADGATLGGTGTWNATNTNWSAAESPVSGATWNATKSAVFEGTAGTVTVGSVSVDEGLIFATTGYTLGSGTITLSGGASANNTITTQPGVTGTISSILAGSNGMTKAGDGTLVLSGNNTFTGGTTIAAGTLQLDPGSWINGTIANEGVLVFLVGSATSTISGNGSLRKDGSGALTISGANSYSGGATLSGGTLRIGHNSALGTGNLTTTASVTIASADATARILENSYTSLSGSGITITLGEAVGGTGNLTFNGTGNLAIGSGGRTLEVLNTTTLKGGITGGGGSITKTGAGTLVLAGANTYTGTTTINEGTLQLGNGGTTGSLSTSSAITVNGTLAFNRSDTMTQGTDFSNTLGGSGLLVQNGSDLLILNQSNSHNGGTTLNSGTLRLDHVGAAGFGTLTQSSGASLLHLNAAGTFANDMSIFNVRASETITLGGGITVNNATFDVDNGDILTISGVIDGSGGVTKNGTGILVLNGNNTYQSATVINSGTLEAASAGALGSNNTVEVNGGSLLVTGNGSLNGKNLKLSTNTIGLQFSGNYSGAIGRLTLSANSIIDLGEGNVGLAFADLAEGLYNQYTLSFYNWSGTTKWGTTYGTGTDTIFFGAGNYTLANVKFYSGPVGSDSFVGSGFEVMPQTTWEGGFTGHYIIPVPEPETWATGIVLILGVAIGIYRRIRLKPTLGKMPANP